MTLSRIRRSPERSSDEAGALVVPLTIVPAMVYKKLVLPLSIRITAQHYDSPFAPRVWTIMLPKAKFGARDRQLFLHHQSCTDNRARLSGIGWRFRGRRMQRALLPEIGVAAISGNLFFKRPSNG
jgi:hypothetical protein